MPEYQRRTTTNKRPPQLKLVWPSDDQPPSPPPAENSYARGFALFGLAWHVTPESLTEQQRILNESCDEPNRLGTMTSVLNWIRRWRR